MHVLQVLATACAFFSVASAKIYDVYVNNTNPYNFSPAVISGVNPYERINFHFTSEFSASVTESTYDHPCSPNKDPGSESFDTGVISETKTVSLDIHQRTPSRWFYSGVDTHCKSGYVFVINPTSVRTLEEFRNRAKNS